MGKITCMQINAMFFLTRYLFAYFSNRIYNRTSNDADYEKVQRTAQNPGRFFKSLQYND